MNAKVEKPVDAKAAAKAEKMNRVANGEPVKVEGMATLPLVKVPAAEGGRGKGAEPDVIWGGNDMADIRKAEEEIRKQLAKEAKGK